LAAQSIYHSTAKQSQSPNITKSSKPKGGATKLFQANTIKAANAASETTISPFTALNFHHISEAPATIASHSNNLSLRVSAEGPSATSSQRYQWLRGMKKKGLTRDNCFKKGKGSAAYS